MGVERFFSSIYKEFNIIKDLNKPYPVYKCKDLLIDFNSIIHTITSIEKNFDYLNIFNQIEKYLINLTNIINCENIYIAIDGVPSLAKMLEQKKRRYLGEIINNIVKNKLGEQNKSDNFNKILISPATDFMTKLSTYLKNIVINDKNIIVSDFNEEGEGEMKIIKYIEKNNLEDVFVYSPDSDMILLLILISIKSIKKLILFRHDQKQSKMINNEYQYVYNYLDVLKFKEILVKYVKSKKIEQFDSQKIINDIVYVFTLFGNDFLPKMESLKVELDLFILIDYYLITYTTDYQYILNTQSVNTKSINTQSVNKVSLNDKKLLQLLEHLSAIEYIFIFRNLQDYLYRNYDINFRNKFIYELKNNQIKNYKEYHYQLIKYVNWLKIFDYFNINPLNYLLISVNELQKYLEEYIKNNKFNFDIFLGENVNDLRFKLELKNRNQSINDKYHFGKTKDYSDEKKIRYQIEYKLDEYSKIFKTNDDFYNNLNLDRLLKDKFDSNYNQIYNNIYKINDYYKTKYLEGWIWIMEYYFNKTKANLYGYFYHKAPLIKDLVKNVKTMSNLKINLDYFEIKPKELLLFITPFKNDEKYIKQELTKLGLDTKLVNKIKNNKQFIFINIINNNIDCTGSIFTSKCHYLPLNQEINLKNFINIIRS
jgi:5'-3' exonuclease